jgi:hypothetical protein
MAHAPAAIEYVVALDLVMIHNTDRGASHASE